MEEAISDNNNCRLVNLAILLHNAVWVRKNIFIHLQLLKMSSLRLLLHLPSYHYPYSSPYLLLLLLLPLPTTTPTPPLTYYYPYSSPYLLLPLLLPLPTTTPTPPLTYYYPYSSPYLLLPLLLPLPILCSPGAWSEVTSMVTYVMMTNYSAPTWQLALIHCCQSVISWTSGRRKSRMGHAERDVDATKVTSRSDKQLKSHTCEHTIYTCASHPECSTAGCGRLAPRPARPRHTKGSPHCPVTTQSMKHIYMYTVYKLS